MEFAALGFCSLAIAEYWLKPIEDVVNMQSKS